MDLQKLLISIGFPPTEARVYLALLRSGRSSASKIIGSTRMHRPDVYDALERLVDKGVATRIIENKVRHYSTSSSALFEFFKRERIVVDEKEALLTENLEGLSSIEGTAPRENEAEVYRGINGAAMVLGSMERRMKKGDVIYGFGRPGFPSELYDKIVISFHKERSEKKVPAYYIYPPSHIHEIKRRRPYSPIKIRYFPKEIMVPGHVTIFRNEVHFWDNSRADIMIFVVRNEAIAKTMLAYFWLFWEQAKTRLR